MQRTLKAALVSLLFNVAFSAYYVIFGALSRSWWLLTLGYYYLVLGVVRFVGLRKSKKERNIEKIAGWMLLLLTPSLVGTVILSVVRDRGHVFHMIVMIAIAAYTTAKVTLATVNFIKSRRIASGVIRALRNLSFADAFVSIFALQRSMLVSFEGMDEREIVIMNAALGSAVCVTVFLLGLNLARKNNV